jgi:hypothetical protein
MNMTVDAAMAASMTDSRCWPNGTLGGILYEGREQFDDRHTHRGPFAPDPLPTGLLAGLQHDALAEGATLALVDRLWPTGSWRTSSARLAAGKIWTHWPRRRCGGGAGTRMIPLATAFPHGRFPPRPTGKPGGSRSVTSTLVVASACSTPTARRPPPPRCCSRPVMAALTGFALVRRCIGCWRTLRASGCSRVCTRSRWRPPRSAP